MSGIDWYVMAMCWLSAAGLFGGVATVMGLLMYFLGEPLLVLPPEILEQERGNSAYAPDSAALPAACCPIRNAPNVRENPAKTLVRVRSFGQV